MQSRIPEKWTTTTVDIIADILDNKRVPVNSDERQNRNNNKPKEKLFPYYGATGQVDVIDDYLFEGEHVLLGEDGAPFLELLKPKAYLVKGKFWVNNHAHILRAIECIASNSFLMHYFNNCDFHGFVTGTTRLKLNQKQLTSIPIPLPPLPEQHRIVAKIEELFSDLDAGIASLRKAKEQLKTYRQSVLKWAFEGKLTEEWRKKNKPEPASELMKRIKAEREKKYKEECEKAKRQGRKKPSRPEYYPEIAANEIAQLFEIPVEWRWEKAGNLFESIVPNRDKPKTFTGNIPWITIPNLRETGCSIDYSTVYAGLSNAEAAQYNARIIPENGVIHGVISNCRYIY
jgi:type I restriction enzyme S subunit